MSLPKNWNLNSTFLSVVIGLSGWNLGETISQGRISTKQSEQIATAIRDTQELRLKIVQLENLQNELRIEIVKVQQVLRMQGSTFKLSNEKP